MTFNRFGVIVNPVAGRGKVGKRFPIFKELAEKTDAVFNYFFTEAPLHAIRIAEKIHKEFDCIVAMGGDGTANEVMNGLAGTSIPFGLIPAGTGNDFARSIHIKKNFKHALEVLLGNSPKFIDLGTINDRIFMNGVGIGFDGYVNAISKKVKVLKGQLVYYYSILKGLFKYKIISVEISINDEIKKSNAFLIAIGNGSSIGGGLKLTPEARLDDEFFDICHISDVPLWKILGNIGRLKTGTIARVKEVEVYRTKNLTISSDVPLPVHIDGEVFETDETTLRIANVPSAVKVIGNWGVD